MPRTGRRRKRALLEIDRERGAGARLQKELDAARGEAARAGAQYHQETQALQQQLGDTRQKVGLLEGQLQAAKAHAEQLAHDSHGAQTQATDAAIRAASLESDRNGWRARAEEAEKAVLELKEGTTKDRRSRRTKPARD